MAVNELGVVGVTQLAGGDNVLARLAVAELAEFGSTGCVVLSAAQVGKVEPAGVLQRCALDPADGVFLLARGHPGGGAALGVGF